MGALPACSNRWMLPIFEQNEFNLLHIYIEHSVHFIIGFQERESLLNESHDIIGALPAS